MTNHPTPEVLHPPLKTWHAFAFLFATAILIYYAKWPILILAALILLLRAWLSFARRFPRTAIFIFAFLRGLRRGRW